MRISRQDRVANDKGLWELKLFARETAKEFQKRIESVGLAALRAQRASKTAPKDIPRNDFDEWLAACRRP
jgi:hypothetical protein